MSQGHIVRSSQIGRNVTSGETLVLHLFDGGIGLIIENNNDYMNLLLYRRGQLSNIEQKAPIATEGNNRTVRSSYSGSQSHRQCTANSTKLHWMNKGARLVHWKIAGTGVAEHRHVRHNYSLMWDCLTDGIQQKHSVTKGMACILTEGSANSGDFSSTRGTILWQIMHPLQRSEE